jgi:hypothetical protein
VGVLQLDGAGVVQVGKRALAELGGVEAGRVQPAVAQADELARGGGDGLALFVGGTRIRRRLTGLIAVLIVRRRELRSSRDERPTMLNAAQ